MNFLEVLGKLFGPLGEFADWIFGWVPRMEVIHYNELLVKYPTGKFPIVVKPGVTFYIKNLTDIEKISTRRGTNEVTNICVETKDGEPVEIGMIFAGHVVDALKWEAENDDAAEAMAEVAQGVLRDVVTTRSWDELTKPAADGTRFGNTLTALLNKALLDKYGFKVETARFNDQARTGLKRGVMHLFGLGASAEGAETDEGEA